MGTNVDEPPSFRPIEVGSTPNNPTDLLLQHDRRLFNLENGVAEALGILNGNVTVLTEGYQSLSSSKEGSQAIFEIQQQLKELAERIKELEDAKSYAGEEGTENDSDEVSISFSGQ